MPIYRSILRSPLGNGQELNVVKVDKSPYVLFVLMEGTGHDPIQRRVRVEVPHQVAVRMAKFILGLDDAARQLPGIDPRMESDSDMEDTQPSLPRSKTENSL